MNGMPGDPRSPRLFAPGVAVLLGYVLLVGNPWINGDIADALSSPDSALHLVAVMVYYPRWHLDLDQVDPFLFWLLNLRTVLFVGLATVGLARISRWFRETTARAGVFFATVGMIALSAVAAGLTAAAMVTILLDTPIFYNEMSEIFLDQLDLSASFGVLFGLVLGAVVAAQHQNRLGVARRAEQMANRRVNAPKSFW